MSPMCNQYTFPQWVWTGFEPAMHNATAVQFSLLYLCYICTNITFSVGHTLGEPFDKGETPNSPDLPRFRLNVGATYITKSIQVANLINIDLDLMSVERIELPTPKERFYRPPTHPNSAHTLKTR